MTSNTNFYVRQILQLFVIADVAGRKRHQRQVEIIIFFTRTVVDSAKLFFLLEMHAFYASLCCLKRMHL